MIISCFNTPSLSLSYSHSLPHLRRTKLEKKSLIKFNLSPAAYFFVIKKNEKKEEINIVNTKGRKTHTN